MAGTSAGAKKGWANRKGAKMGTKKEREGWHTVRAGKKGKGKILGYSTEWKDSGRR